MLTLILFITVTQSENTPEQIQLSIQTGNIYSMFCGTMLLVYVGYGQCCAVFQVHVSEFCISNTQMYLNTIISVKIHYRPKNTFCVSWLHNVGSFTDNSLTNQLADNQVADNPTRRQTNSPKLIYGRFGTYTPRWVDRFS